MRVLLVEDDADMVEMLRLILGELAGWEVESYLSGEVLLDSLAEVTPPDLGLVDLNMDPVTGPELVRQLTDRGWRDFPILYLTGQPPSSEDLLLVDGWIQKPFTYDELMDQLREKLGDRLPI
jgi:DNA-binding response OmpR family regulator